MHRNLLSPAVQRQLKRLPSPYDSHYGVVPLPPPETGIVLTDIASRHSAAIAAMARADLLEKIASVCRIGRVFERQEAVTSSSIEGTNSTLDELLMLDENDDENAAADTKQVRDYALTLGRLIGQATELGPAIFTLDFIRQLHHDIMKGDRDYRDTPGRFRSVVVWIGGGRIAESSWNAPPPDDVMVCLEQTLDYMRNDGMQQLTQDFITRLAVAHAHFEAVHPFRDGNGRAGRLLLPLMMVAEGHAPLYLSAYIEKNKGGYYGALKNAQQRLDWSAIVGFLCDAIVSTVEHMEETIATLQALRMAWLKRRRFRQKSASVRALDVILTYPVITVNRLAQELDVGVPRASDAINQLVEAGILVERTGYKRNRLFSATEVLTVVNRPFGDLQNESSL